MSGDGAGTGASAGPDEARAARESASAAESERARRPVRALFIANRGEIAARIATTARRLGILPIVPVVSAGGESRRDREDGGDRPPGPAPAPVDLLDPEAVVRAALAAGADAVHPGYGFLAESPDLAEAALAAGLTWVGPPAEAIRTLGDKARAREIAERLGIPVAAGEEPEDQSDASLAASAQRIGLPLVVKPAAGGGGKGIRVVRRHDDLQPAVDAARREAARAFADDRLILERLVAPARHVEVQVLADAHGGVIHLGDRDCSLQRRHQKVLEEAPAPGLAPQLRAALRTAACRLARAVGYEGAGTCEFLVGDDGSWVFLEMNARLQVEHPVTELVLGRDLVADQVRIAAGAALAELGLDQAGVDAAIERGGHAVEVRLNAEDPAVGFLPSAGRVVALRWPAGASAFGPAPGGVRVDAGIVQGEHVGGAFDPLLAKVIAHGRNRAEALARLADALDATEVLGLVTNLAFLRHLVRSAAVVDGRARTETLEGLADVSAPTAAIPGDAWDVAALVLADAAGGDPWGGGGRLNAPASLRLNADGPSGPEVRRVELESTSVSGAPSAAPGVPAPFAVRDGDTVHVSVDGRSVPFRLAPPPELDRTTARPGPAGAELATELRAPMPGVVLGVHVEVGASVDAGDRVVTLEAMKMEHVVSAPRSGRVAELLVEAGDRVERGRLVARLEAGA